MPMMNELGSFYFLCLCSNFNMFAVMIRETHTPSLSDGAHGGSGRHNTTCNSEMVSGNPIIGLKRWRERREVSCLQS